MLFHFAFVCVCVCAHLCVYLCVYNRKINLEEDEGKLNN